MLNEWDIITKVALAVGGGTLTLFFLYLNFRFSSGSRRMDRIENTVDQLSKTAVNQDFCALQHRAATQHTDDILRPVMQQMSKIANGKLDEVIERMVKLEEWRKHLEGKGKGTG